MSIRDGIARQGQSCNFLQSTVSTVFFIFLGKCSLSIIGLESPGQTGISATDLLTALTRKIVRPRLSMILLPGEGRGRPQPADPVDIQHRVGDRICTADVAGPHSARDSAAFLL